MKTKTILLLALTICYCTSLFSQTSLGTLSGILKDSATGQPIDLANVVIFQNGNQIAGASTDEKGYFSIAPIKPGKYDVGATHMNYKQFLIKEVRIAGTIITVLDIDLAIGDYTLPPVDIPVPKKELIPKDIGGIGIVMIAEEIDRMPTESIVDIIDLTPGIINGEVQANRTGSTVYIVDGMKIRGDLAINMNTVQEIRVLRGGIPAEYGDILGGVVIIETKNPLNRYYCFDNSKRRSRKKSR